MKSFLMACATGVGIAIVAWVVLTSGFQVDSTTAFTTEGARVTPEVQNQITY